MKLKIDLEDIDLSNHHVGLDFPAIEKSVRDVAKDFIRGVVEENMYLEITTEESGGMYVVLWANLFDGSDRVVAYIPIEELFDEYIKGKANETDK
mgnify:CR=1 FL=1